MIQQRMTYEALYAEAIANGATPLLADMLASRQPPGTKGTDRAFMQGKNNDPLPNHPAPLARRILKDANKAGIPTAGRVYCGSIADHRAWRDPAAWVQGVDDVRSVAKIRNLNCEGSVQHTAHEETPKAPIKLAEDIVQRKMRRYAAESPGKYRDKKSQNNLREMVIEKHGARST